MDELSCNISSKIYVERDGKWYELGIGAIKYVLWFNIACMVALAVVVVGFGILLLGG